MKIVIRPPFLVDDRRICRPVYSVSNHLVHALLAGEKPARVGKNVRIREA